MTGKSNEMTDLLGQHDAIRAQMNFLADSLKKLVRHPGISGEKSVQLKERIQSYCYALRDLRDGVISHIELDERIFGTRPPEIADRSLAREHESIRKQIDRAIQLADEAIDGKLSEDELNQHVSEITETVDKIRRLIRTHTAKEDRLLKSL